MPPNVALGNTTVVPKIRKKRDQEIQAGSSFFIEKSKMMAEDIARARSLVK